MDSLMDVARRPFLDIAADVAGAILYLDAGASEVAQLSLGSAFLWGLGAANVCELERAHPDDALLPALTVGEPPTTLALFVTQLLTDSHQSVMRALLAHPQVTCCLIYSSISEHAHALQASTVLGVEAYSEYASVLQQDATDARAAAARAQQPQQQQQWSGALHVRVQHLPLDICALDSTAFVLPSASAAATMACSADRAAGYGPADAARRGAPRDDSDDDADEDAVGVSGGLELLAHVLAGMAGQLNVKLDAFSVGPVSQQVAREFSTLTQRTRRTTNASNDGEPTQHASTASAPPSSMALVLMDRSLDLATPCMHSDHPWDLMLSLLPRRLPAPMPLPGAAAHMKQEPRVMWRPADVRVDVPELAPLDPLSSAPAPSDTSTDTSTTHTSAPGTAADSSGSTGFAAAPLTGMSLFHPSDRRAIGLLEQLALAPKGRDAGILLRRLLKEGLRAEKVASTVRSKLGGVAPAELRGLAGSLAGAPDAALKQQALIALGCGAAEALGCPAAQRWEALAALERQLLMLLPQGAEGADALVAMLLDATATVARHKGLLNADDILTLLVLLYSLCGDLMPPAAPFYSADEQRLREAVVAALAAAGAAVVQCLPDAQERLVQVQAATSTTSSTSSPEQSDAHYAQQALRLELSDRVADIFARLKWAAAARGKLRDVRRLMVGDGGGAEVVPLVRQVLAKILLQADNRDLQQPESGSQLRGLLNMGLGRLGLKGPLSSARGSSSISDYPAVLLFVVGGISPAEVRAVRQELDAHTFGHKPVVLLGGTALLAPGDAVRQLLAT